MKLSLIRILNEAYYRDQTLKNRLDFKNFYTREKIQEIRDRAEDPEQREQDVLEFLHNFSRNMQKGVRPGDVTSALGDYAGVVLHKLHDKGLIKVDEYGYITPGKQAAALGSFIKMYIGGQGH